MRDAEEQRAQSLARWEGAAAGWGRAADRIRAVGMEVSTRMIDALHLQPGQRVLELAAGPGDTGFLAAELIRPGGTLISSDGTEAMLAVARERGERFGIENVEFKRLELEWIDLPTASVDAILCRWAVMLVVDPPAAVQETRRVLRPGGRIAVAVWDESERNPWATVAFRAFMELGHVERPDPEDPGPFALGAPGALEQLLEGAGFLEVEVQVVDLPREYAGVHEYVEEAIDFSPSLSELSQQLSASELEAIEERIAALAAPFTDEDGTLRLPGSSLVASAVA